MGSMWEWLISPATGIMGSGFDAYGGGGSSDVWDPSGDLKQMYVDEPIAMVDESGNIVAMNELAKEAAALGEEPLIVAAPPSVLYRGQQKTVRNLALLAGAAFLVWYFFLRRGRRRRR